MNISNFHTHTMLCKHANGLPEDYVAQAVKDGCSELGFSDHCPYPQNEKDNWDYCRMSLNDVFQYKESVLQVGISKPIKVHLGFECEWDADYKNWYEDVLKGTYGAEYLVYGAHWVTEGNNHIYIRDCATDKTLFHRYINQFVEGMNSGLYAFVAHPDLFMSGRTDWDDDAEVCSKEIISAANDLHLPLEINGYGIVKTPVKTNSGSRYPYPVREFWEMAKKMNATVICNSDAHDPSVVIENAKKARSFAQELGIVPLENLDLTKALKKS